MLKIILAIIMTFQSFFFTSFNTLFPLGNLYDGGIRVQYNDSTCGYMDVYLPADTSGSLDVIFAIHGGSWMSGDQTMFTDYAKAAAEHGCVGVTVDYDKLLNKATAHVMVNEIHTAVCKLKELLDARGISTDKMMIFSHSSGSHLALLYAYTHTADCPIPIGFLTAMSSPADLTLKAKGTTMLELWRSSMLTLLTGENITDRTLKTEAGRAAVAEINPIDHVSPGVPPTLLVHGSKDNVVPYENSPLLCEKLHANGVDSEVITFEGDGHKIRYAPDVLEQRMGQTLRDWAEKNM